MYLRRPIVAANWKMNKTPSQTAEYLQDFLPRFGPSCAAEVILVPPFTSLPKAAEGLAGHPVVKLGAQNVHPEPNGAFTGEVSLEFLKELNVSHVVIGHSERRQYFSETDLFINKKVRAILKAAQRARHVGTGTQPLQFEEAALHRLARAGVGHQAQKAVLHLCFGMRGNEGAFALAAHQHAIGSQRVQRLAHGALADLEALRQFGLARQRLAGLPLAGTEAARQQTLDLLVQRTERRRRLVGSGSSSGK